MKKRTTADSKSTRPTDWLLFASLLDCHQKVVPTILYLAATTTGHRRYHDWFVVVTMPLFLSVIIPILVTEMHQQKQTTRPGEKHRCSHCSAIGGAVPFGHTIRLRLVRIHPQKLPRPTRILRCSKTRTILRVTNTLLPSTTTMKTGHCPLPAPGSSLTMPGSGSIITAAAVVHCFAGWLVRVDEQQAAFYDHVPSSVTNVAGCLL
jgi:hypothetical protein